MIRCRTEVSLAYWGKNSPGWKFNGSGHLVFGCRYEKQGMALLKDMNDLEVRHDEFGKSLAPAVEVL
jgi:hypothetical protein